MTPYALTLLALLGALLAQSLATGVALAAALRKPYRRSWMAFTLGSGLLALQHSYAFELTLRSGIYDLRQATLAGVVALLLALGALGLRQEFSR